jgi:hypothetical protein
MTLGFSDLIFETTSDIQTPDSLFRGVGNESIAKFISNIVSKKKVSRFQKSLKK